MWPFPLGFVFVWSGRPRPLLLLLVLVLVLNFTPPTTNDNLPPESPTRAAPDSAVCIPPSPGSSHPTATHGQTTPPATPAPSAPAPGSSCARTPIQSPAESQP